jgi:hypothetical protein
MSLLETAPDTESRVSLVQTHAGTWKKHADMSYVSSIYWFSTGELEETRILAEMIFQTDVTSVSLEFGGLDTGALLDSDTERHIAWSFRSARYLMSVFGVPRDSLPRVRMHSNIQSVRIAIM